jgi:hypothetical protein
MECHPEAPAWLDEHRIPIYGLTAGGTTIDGFSAAAAEFIRILEFKLVAAPARRSIFQTRSER